MQRRCLKYIILIGFTMALFTPAPLLALADENKPLIFLHYWSGALSGGIEEMTREFNRTNPTYQVKATSFDHEFFKVGINAMLAGGNPPDLFSYWAGAKVQTLVDKQYLAPIDDVWQTAQLDDIFSTPVSQACTYSGHKYAIPVTQHYVAFFYNTQIFNHYNIRPPDTWEAFITACEKLKRVGVTPIALGSRERWPAQFWFDYLLLRTAGPEYRQQLMTGQASYSDPEVITAFALWKELLDKGYFNASPNQLDWADAAKLVHSGKAAMTLMGTWIIGLFDSQLQWTQQTDYDFFPFPAMKTTVPMTALGPIDVIVIPRLGRAAKAQKVLAYFSDPGPQMAMSRGSGALSPSRALHGPFYTPMQNRILTVINNTPQWAFNYDLATPPAVAEIGLDALKAFILSPSKYKQILADTDKHVQPVFQNPQQ